MRLNDKFFVLGIFGLIAGILYLNPIPKPVSTNDEIAIADEVKFTKKPLKIVGYYTNWAMYRKPSFKPSDINPKLVTHINYAFVKPEKDGTLTLLDPWADTDYRTDWNSEKPFWGNFKQLQDLKNNNPHLKTLISVGGWTLSDNFSTLAQNSETRKNFASNCVKFCDTYGFDGIDIDWEYPGFGEHSGRPVDRQNFTLLLAELSSAAKSHNPPLLLTFAAPAAEPHLKNLEISQISPLLDWINIMTYDFHGPWGPPADPVTNHNAPLDPPEQGNQAMCVSKAVQYYLENGFPQEKIVLGIPLYGRSFADANSTETGLFSSYSGPGPGTTEEKGIRFYSDIKNNLLKTYHSYWDNKAKVPYLYNPKNKEFISYDNPQSIELKCRLVKDLNLGGAMVWELGFDTLPDYEAMTIINNSLK